MSLCAETNTGADGGILIILACALGAVGKK